MVSIIPDDVVVRGVIDSEVLPEVDTGTATVVIVVVLLGTVEVVVLTVVDGCVFKLLAVALVLAVSAELVSNSRVELFKLQD